MSVEKAGGEGRPVAVVVVLVMIMGRGEREQKKPRKCSCWSAVLGFCMHIRIQLAR